MLFTKVNYINLFLLLHVIKEQVEVRRRDIGDTNVVVVTQKVLAESKQTTSQETDKIRLLIPDRKFIKHHYLISPLSSR